MAASPLILGGVSLDSRLIHGTGRFPSSRVLADSIAASGSDMITLAIRRLHLDDSGNSELADLDLARFKILPNTAGARDADESIRLARLARAAGLSEFIKVEVVGDPASLLPDPAETLRATRELVAQGFKVMPYTSDDVVLALQLAEAGAVAVMPGAAPIGTTLGPLNPHNLKLIIQRCPVPVIVDAGIGAPSQAARVMEWGAGGVLVNTAIARAADPVSMAHSFGMAVAAGREAYLAGLASAPSGSGGFGPSSPADEASASRPLPV